MPVTLRSATRPSAAATAAPVAVSAHSYSLRSARPESGYYAEVDEEMEAAAETLLSLHSGAAVAPASVRRSARLATRS